jgi:hypothetical protein
MSSPWPQDYYTPVAEMDKDHILKKKEGRAREDGFLKNVGYSNESIRMQANLMGDVPFRDGVERALLS